MHALKKVLVAPGAAKFVVGILGPRVDRPLEATLDNVDKAGVDELVFVSGWGVQGAVDLLGCLHQHPVPLADGAVGGQGVVVRDQGVENVKEFDVTVWVEVPRVTVRGGIRSGDGGNT